MNVLPDTLITTHLELAAPGQFRPAYVSDPALLIMQAKVPQAAFSRYLYRLVGEAWHWRDRLLWSDEALGAHLSRPEVSVHVLYVDGTPGGYIELERQGASTEISYFGLAPAFTGRGYGKHLLSAGVRSAWDAGASRIWVHTCNLDSPAALPNYQARGFVAFKVEEEAMPQRFRESWTALTGS